MIAEMYEDVLNNEALFSDLEDVILLLKRPKINGERFRNCYDTFLHSVGLEACRTQAES